MIKIRVYEGRLSDGSPVYDVFVGDFSALVFHTISEKDAVLFAEAVEKAIDKHTTNECAIVYDYDFCGSGR